MLVRFGSRASTLASSLAPPNGLETAAQVAAQRRRQGLTNRALTMPWLAGARPPTPTAVYPAADHRLAARGTTPPASLPVIARTACGRHLSATPKVSASSLIAEPTSLSRPARGQAISEYIAIHLRHRLGNSANLTENVVAKWMMGLYVGNVMNFLYVTWRWETPGAAPCRQKRGPRPHPTGRRGRLPNWKATPCRVFEVTQVLYKNELTTVLISVSWKQVPRTVAEVTLLILVVG